MFWNTPWRPNQCQKRYVFPKWKDRIREMLKTKFKRRQLKRKENEWEMLSSVGIRYITLTRVSIFVPSLSISGCGRVARTPSLELSASRSNLDLSWFYFTGLLAVSFVLLDDLMLWMVLDKGGVFTTVPCRRHPWSIYSRLLLRKYIFVG